MKFFINSRSGVPIYKQIIMQIEKGVAGEILKPGERLPTVREVALELTVNPNTVARAYRELELRGVISSVQGRGTFIAKNITPVTVEHKEIMIKRLLEELLQEARQLGFKPPELNELFREALERWQEGGLEDE